MDAAFGGDDSKNADENDKQDYARTVIVQCRKCKTIIGDSTSFRHSDEQNQAVAYRGSIVEAAAEHTREGA